MKLIGALAGSVIAILVLGIQPAFAADLLIDDVPIPDTVKVADAGSPADDKSSRFIGTWVGAWGNTTHHVLIVESVDKDGTANVVYAVGPNPRSGVKPQWLRLQAKIEGATLKVRAPFSASYTLGASHTAMATWVRGERHAWAEMSKADLSGLRGGAAAPPWVQSERSVSMLDSGLVERGKPVRLELVVYKPAGNGPFPLLVFHHGSTGSGRDPALFGQTQFFPPIAEYFARKGWMVAFPQRRGRGKSDGDYDEGFAPNRAQGYACQAKYSLPGADRALADIRAAMAVLIARPDIDAKRVVIGGQSRGGILAAAYAGMHPTEVKGVINFVGGWMSERCPESVQINRNLFSRGAKFPGRMLWLYADGDPYYSVTYSSENFRAFLSRGGKGDFVTWKPPVGSGHGLWGWPELWFGRVDQYLAAIGADK